MPVVLANPSDPFFVVAREFSELLSAPLLTTEKADPARARASTYLVASSPFLDQRLVRHLKDSGLASLGIVSAPNLGQAREVCFRLAEDRSHCIAKSWIATSGLMSEALAGDFEFIDTGAVKADDFRVLTRAHAGLGLVVGHGREDVCYFENFAICGQTSGLACGSCTPDECPIHKTKIFGNEVGAELLIVFSCYAGRIGEGLFPPECRLSLSLLQGSSRSIIAPAGLLTLTSDLIAVAVRAFLTGSSPADIANLCEDFHRINTGEHIELNVFGDPGVSGTVVRNMRVSARQGRKDVERLAGHLRCIESGLKSLRSLGLLPEEGEELALALERSFDKLGRLAHQVAAGRSFGQKLVSIADDFRALAKGMEEQVMQTLMWSVGERYFWLAEHYDWFKRVENDSGVCPQCLNDTRLETFRHPFETTDDRIRVSCERCGVIEDRGRSGASVTLPRYKTEVSSGNNVMIELETTISGPTKDLLIGAAINSGASLVKYSEVRYESGRVDNLPCRLREGGTVTIRIYISRPRAGIYVAKVFAVRDLHITEASSPISFLGDAAGYTKSCDDQG